ncbi:lipoprotein [Mycoplasma sp. HU2014]|uniref:lipoprotein n=1 Tax=Mycoplasma sp. HU2014 TaxID=1664275 RepID=UPI00067E427E|nr:lipoprotein [Mycoplasma sp. HU2014]KNG79670.1 lipoprotein [Mycoplasma sp. HU2014]
MKKLLTILGSFTMATTAGVTAVACKTEQKKPEENKKPEEKTPAPEEKTPAPEEKTPAPEENTTPAPTIQWTEEQKEIIKNFSQDVKNFLTQLLSDESDDVTSDHYEEQELKDLITDLRLDDLLNFTEEDFGNLYDEILDVIVELNTRNNYEATLGDIEDTINDDIKVVEEYFYELFKIYEK